jgi:indole-3-glycerol phosphate synthase
VASTQGALERAAAAQTARPDLVAALRGPVVRVIAEVKRASPSRGAIAPALAADRQAAAYAAGGAAAISVLTEPTAFGGALADLEAVVAAVTLPAIRKDFVVHPVQVWEAAALGAAGVLLIARALAPDVLGPLVAEAGRAGLTPLVEVRTMDELDRALHAGARVVGVNNRDLETLQIDPTTAERLVPHIPPECIAIAESGLQGPGDVDRYARVGADAVLVGSMVSSAPDPALAVRQLTTAPRCPR